MTMVVSTVTRDATTQNASAVGTTMREGGWPILTAAVWYPGSTWQLQLVQDAGLDRPPVLSSRGLMLHYYVHQILLLKCAFLNA